MTARSFILLSLLPFSIACGGDDSDSDTDGALVQVTGGDFVAPENAFWDAQRNVWYVSDFGEPMGAPATPIGAMAPSGEEASTSPASHVRPIRPQTKYSLL